jgi:hypothetical protein
MNVEVLNTICISLIDELNKTGINSLLSQLSSNMQDMINRPQTPQYQQNVSNIKIEIISKLRKTKINDFSPFWKENLKELGFEGLLGNELADNIEKTFENNQITMSVAHQEIVNLSQKLSTLITSITQLINNFKTLNIGIEKLQSGQSEFEILIPRMAINQDMKQFSDEILEIKKIIDDFNELIIGSRPEIKLKTIASSDYSILLEILPKVGLELLKAISLIIITYQSILEIKKHHKELKQQGIPEEDLKGIENYANKKMAESISEGVTKLIEEYSSKMDKIDKGRKNELSISINMSMNKISNRIDNGYNFDVRFSDDKIDVDNDVEDEKEARQQINSMSKNLTFMNSTGEKILSLPEKKE